MVKLRFLLPSILGVLIFLTPIEWNGTTTIGIGITTQWIKELFGPFGLHLVVGLTLATCVLTLLGTVFRVSWIHSRKSYSQLFVVSPIWLLLRLAGTLFGLCYFLQIGPELLTSEDIGGAVFIGIGVNVIAVYIAACLLLPLVTEFGLMEFAGTLARPVFRRLFKLPGQAAIDAVTSVVGASAIGLLVSIDQYERGRYTDREASVIATNFSVVSLPFSLVVATVAGIDHLFLPWYGVVILTCLIAALITARLPPLSNKADRRCVTPTQSDFLESCASDTLLHEAWIRALDRAAQAPGLREYFGTALTNLAFFSFSVVTATMALATLAALLVFHTPVFSWLGSPLILILEFAHLPEATAAAPALFSGFLDQYMPALAAADIKSPATSFVLAGLSVCQLIFMSEVGVIILRSSLPVSFGDLVAIFLWRTVISLPLLILGGLLVAS